MDEDGLNIPITAISPSSCRLLIELIDSRLGLVGNGKVSATISTEDAEVQLWFLKATDDAISRQQIFSSKSMKKLEDLKNMSAWLRWLKATFEEAETLSAESLALELERSQNLPDSGTKEKWCIRIRILCTSHSIRPKTLRAWNDNFEFIKLQAVSKKKDQLFVDIILEDNVPLEAIWYLGWGVARRFVIALNIGTMGFWWWRKPEQTSRYYEKSKRGLDPTFPLAC